MVSEKLNNLVGTYYRTNDQQVFSEIYECIADYMAVNERVVIRSGYGTKQDAQQIFDETLFKLISRGDILDFRNALTAALKKARLYFYRREKQYRKRYILAARSKSANSDEAPTSHLLAADIDLEEEVLENLKKKKDQQHQLLISLHESARIPFDSKMVDAIEELPRFSLEALAKALGVGRNTIARKLERLERAYDRNKHGDITEYISSSLRMKRQYIAS